MRRTTQIQSQFVHKENLWNPSNEVDFDLEIKTQAYLERIEKKPDKKAEKQQKAKVRIENNVKKLKTTNENTIPKKKHDGHKIYSLTQHEEWTNNDDYDRKINIK